MRPGQLSAVVKRTIYVRLYLDAAFLEQAVIEAAFEDWSNFWGIKATQAGNTEPLGEKIQELAP